MIVSTTSSRDSFAGWLFKGIDGWYADGRRIEVLLVVAKGFHVANISLVRSRTGCKTLLRFGCRGWTTRLMHRNKP